MSRAKSKPTTPSATSSADPIFAAIEAHRGAWAALQQTVTDWGKFDLCPEDDDCRIETGLGHFVKSPGDVDSAVADALDSLTERFGKMFAAPLQRHVKRMGKTIKAQLKAAEVFLENRRDMTGYNAAWERHEEAELAEGRALGFLLNTRPTTLAGLEALAAYAGRIYADTIEGGRYGEPSMLLKTIESAAFSLHITHERRGP